MKKLLITLVVVLSVLPAPAQRADAGKQLKYALILTRHGVRSPTWTPDRLNQYSTAPWPDWKVPPGNLTPHGRGQMKILGEFYRQYFSSDGLLGMPNCADAGRTYFWADTDQRTLESARALAEGILPGCKADIRSMQEGKDDPLFDPIDAGLVKQDPRLGVAAVVGRIGPSPDAVVSAHRVAFDVLDHILNGNGKAANSIFSQPMAVTAGESGVTLSGPLALASTLTENLLLEYTNGMTGDQLGWGRLNATNLQQVMALHTAYADLMRRTPYLARVRGSILLTYILRSLEQAVTGKPVTGAAGTPTTTLVVVSGHDTNVSNISGMLGLSWVMPSHQPDDIPPGGALIFSLWQSAETRRYSVRVQFVAQTLDQMHDATPLSLASPPSIANVFIPGCGTAQEGFACEWENFQRTVAMATR